MKRRLRSLIILVLTLFALDVTVAGVDRASRLSDRVAEIHHPTTLLSKLDRLRTASGPKVVLLGDSLVYGGVQADHGDPDWREHELGTRLADEWERQTGVRPFLMNLGMNGALPSDLEVLAPLVAASNVDWIVLDVHLRPFSADFSAPETRMSRPWLRDLSLDPDGRVHWRPGRGAGGWLSGHLADHSALVRHRGLFQDNFLTSHAAKQPILRTPARRSETDAEVQSLVKLVQLKNRLKALDLAPDGPQVAALARTLGRLAGRGQRHVVFYAKENPEQLPDVMDPDEHRACYERVVSLVRDVQGPIGVFVPPVPELRADHFLDFTHLNADGYTILACRLAAVMK